MTSTEAQRQAVKLLGMDAVAHRMHAPSPTHRFFIGSKALNRAFWGSSFDEVLEHIRAKLAKETQDLIPAVEGEVYDIPPEAFGLTPGATPPGKPLVVTAIDREHGVITLE